MNDKIKSELISIILSAFGSPVKGVEISRDDVEIITSIAKRLSIIPVIVEGIKNLGHSELLTNSLLEGEAKAVYDYTQRKVSLEEIANAFENASIAFIPLKGSVLRDLYPQPWMRTSSDIDVLIHEKELVKAINVLKTETSFRLYKHDRHDVHFVNDYVLLELHYTFDYVVERVDRALADPWDYAFPVNNTFLYTFAPEYNLFYIVSHAAKDLIQNGGIGIRPILDIYVFRAHYNIDENKVKSFCDKAGLLGFYEICCKIVDVWFNGVSHDDISRDFEDLVISCGVYGSKHLKIISNKRRDSGKKYISSRIFKTREELSNYYPKCRKYPFLVPYYQVVRWTKVLNSNKSKAYLSEFKQADAIDQSEVEKYDRLMKAMGL